MVLLTVGCNVDHCIMEEIRLKSGRVDFARTARVDAEQGVLHGVILCQVGEAKGHGVHLEQSFIEEGIDYAVKHYANRGMKARFGHPSMSNETLGTEMGRFKDFRVEEDRMVADLHLFKSANLSPTQPGMRDWMISMAQEDPQAIMCSIVFSTKGYYQRSADGKKYAITRKYSDDRGYYWESDDPAYRYDPKGKIFVSLKKLLFCDIVDEGAATDRLFSAEVNSEKFSVIATDFLNNYPQVDQFIREHPEKLLSFLSARFGLYAGELSGTDTAFQKLLDGLKSLFGKGKRTPENPFDFYMSKIQLGSMSALALALHEGTATPDQFAAAQRELQEQGVDVVILNPAAYRTQQDHVAAMKLAVKSALASAGIETPTDEQLLAPDVAIADAFKKKQDEVTSLTTQVADLTKKLGSAGKPDPIVTEEEELETAEDDSKQFETSVDRELRQLQKKFGL